MKRDDGEGTTRRPDIRSAAEAQQELQKLRGKNSPSCLQQLVAPVVRRLGMKSTRETDSSEQSDTLEN